MNHRLLVGVVLAGLSACGSKTDTTPSASASANAAASASASGSATEASADAGPWSVAIDSKTPLVLGELDGGVAVIDATGVRLAIASTDAKLEEHPAPMGFASDVTRVLRIQGRAPEEIWITAEGAVPEGKKHARTPFYRLQKTKLKQIAEDWNPIVVPWSKKRVLVMSTSSERLKVKVLEPYTKKLVDDQPSVHFPAPECAKSIQLAEAVSLPSGEVVGAGKCKTAGMKTPAYVALRWAAVVPPPSQAPSAVPEASGAPESKPEEADDTRGAPLTLLVVTSNHVQHRRIAVGPNGHVFFAATGDGAGESFLYEIAADRATKVELPKLDGALLDVAFTASGDLFAITQDSAWRKPANGDWTSVSPSDGFVLSHLASAGDVMFASGARSAAKDAAGLLLRFGRGPGALHWQ